MSNNEITVTIPEETKATIYCAARAGYTQKVTLRWGNNTRYFSGAGEGVRMLTPDGQSEVAIHPGPEKSKIELKITFEHERDGVLHPSEAREPKWSGDVFTVESEDGCDTDWDDAVVTGVLQSHVVSAAK